MGKKSVRMAKGKVVSGPTARQEDHRIPDRGGNEDSHCTVLGHKERL